MSDEKRLIGDVKRDGTLLYELTTVDGPHGRKVESNRWEAGVGSVMRACSMAEREQIAERLRVAANAFEPMRKALDMLSEQIKVRIDPGLLEELGRAGVGDITIRADVLLACLRALRAADETTEGR